MPKSHQNYHHNDYYCNQNDPPKWFKIRKLIFPVLRCVEIHKGKLYIERLIIRIGESKKHYSIIIMLKYLINLILSDKTFSFMWRILYLQVSVNEIRSSRPIYFVKYQRVFQFLSRFKYKLDPLMFFSLKI